MGKASRWLRGLFGMKKPNSLSSSSKQSPPPQHGEMRPWSFVTSHKDTDDGNHRSNYRELGNDGVDPERQEISLVAVAGTRAAASGVWEASRERHPPVGNHEQRAALKIQSAFRGYLARRARRALKGVVKIQALVRGHIERKRNAMEVQQMQALLRAQARALAGRKQTSGSSCFHHPGPKTPEKSEQFSNVKAAKRVHSPTLPRNGIKLYGRTSSYQETVQLDRNKSERCTDEGRWELQRGSSTRNYPYEEPGDKILEIDTVSPFYTQNHQNPSPSSAARCQIGRNLCSYSGEKHHMDPLNLTGQMEQTLFFTAGYSPQFYSATSLGGSQRSSFTPTKSCGSKSFLTRYTDHPNYMAYTESSKAKVRSLSTPKQRPQFEKPRSNKRHSIHGFSISNSSALVSSNKAYPGSGRLDRMGMPVSRVGAASSVNRQYN
ncbi:hypothetical protein SAY86_001499 [Trapa natans]|uniref:DUF4005 domain-containing protein n=1 Tax=Trapa natans TaxID=22666 RepID=A0AAN7RMG2_TRANT|nr:hypothetical protein SAY86_001499 [Trapa natans]